MTYREHAPPPALAPWLACTWSRVGDGAPPVRVVPDGCIDIVWTEGAATLLVGPNTTAFEVVVPAGVRVAGARFRPGAAGALLGIAPEGVRDARPALAEAWGEDGRRLADDLEAGEDRVAVLVRALAGRARAAPAPDPLVGAAVAALARPEATVGALARELAVSERQLRRRTAAAVGYGPKRLARVLRLTRALDAARGGAELARVAAETGYADQAHFANECRALAGAPPSALL